MATMAEAVVKFNAEVQQWAETQPKEAIRTLQRYLSVEALKRIVMKTPVDTGRARGNWQLTINDLPENELAAVDKTGEGTVATGIATLKDLGFFSIVYITNNVPYIVYLEDGTSKQAPQGMVKVTIEELTTIF